jgi:hypothetical protein
MMECIVPSVNLENLAEYCYNKSLDAVKLVKNRSFLEDVGRLVIIDIILNNSDRIPVGNLWDNDGNPSNVLIYIADSEKLRIAAIDQALIPILIQNQHQKYLERISNFAQELQSDNIHSIYLDSICKFLENCIGKLNIFTEEDRAVIYNAMKQTVQFATESLTKEELERLKSDVDHMKRGEDWSNVWLNSINTINTDFIYSIIQALLQYTN